MGVIRGFNSISEDDNNEWTLEDFIEENQNNNQQQQNLNEANENNHQNNVNTTNNNQLNHSVDTNQRNNERFLSEEYLEEYARQAERNRARRLQKARRAQATASVRPEPTFRALGCRGKSYKKYRRYENANMLSQVMVASASIDLDDNELLNDISIHDFMPQTAASAFTQLLMEAKNMQAWNRFILQSEDEQEYFIRSVDADEYEEIDGICIPARMRAKGKGKNKGDKGKRKRSSNSLESEDGGVMEDFEETPSGSSKVENEDKRATHPCFSAAECFERISNDIKSSLRRKHVPLGLLAAIEEEVIDFFDTKPSAVYKSCLASAYQRLLLHACCQYMDLRCSSFDKDGSRWSRVQNLNRAFERPEMLLTSYLEEHYS